MQLFLHTLGNEGPELVDIEATALVRELVVERDSDGKVWIQEVDEEVDLDITLEEAGIKHRHHVHHGRCHRVEVVIRFNADRFEGDFGPGTTFKTVYKWAAGSHAANLSADQAAKHVLALPGANAFLDAGVHIGSLLTEGSCKVTLDLLPRERFEG